MGFGSLLNVSVGEYRLVDFIGAGGMGEVYRAVHSKIGRVVAVKVLTSPSASLVERFLNEARVQASLHHPNIATLYDFLEVNGQPCIVMEYVDGQPLIERIRSAGKLPVEEAVRVFHVIVSAINYIHGCGIVHRDIKSNNVKLSSTGAVKLLDFGIAKTESSPSLTLAGDVIGTLQYLSPEQIKGGGADARSDIWALGVLLYEMLTGQLPFDANTLGSLCDKITRAGYVAPSTLNSSVPADIEAVIARCLSKKPAGRYANCAELLADLSRLEESKRKPDSRTARPAGARSLDSAMLSAKRHWRALAFGGLALCVAAVCIVLFGIYFSAPSQKAASPAPAANRDAAQTNSNASRGTSAARSHVKPLQIDAIEGRAEVYLNGAHVGSTPYDLNARVGDRVDLVLKREGYVDRHEEFEVTENRKVYTFSLAKKE